MHKYLEITQDDFAWCAEFIFGLVLQHLVSQGVRNFAQDAKFIFLNLALRSATCSPLDISHAMRNRWMLDFFSDSLPCILDWFGKGYEALQSLDFLFI